MISYIKEKQNGNFFVEFNVCNPDGYVADEFVLVNPSEVIAVTQPKADSNFVSLRLSSGDRLHVTGVRSEILDKLGIVVR